jgi:3-hydroxyacyl-CoA dehydrogenase/3a,7a,12a-trihydroxy-5b-cholest-24-enoyl-CoA hydratase
LGDQVNAIFQFNVKNESGEEKTWVLDFKKSGTIKEGSVNADIKPDIVISLSDATFWEIVEGKLNGQKAFMSGKLKVKGNMMLATRVDGILGKFKPKASSAGTSKSAAPNASSAASGSAGLFKQIQAGIEAMPSSEREALVKKTKAVFQFDINAGGSSQSYSIDLKNGHGSVTLGPSKVKPDVTMILSDKDFVELAQGRLNGQKAFMSGKLKIKGQMMLATKCTWLCFRILVILVNLTCPSCMSCKKWVPYQTLIVMILYPVS